MENAPMIVTIERIAEAINLCRNELAMYDGQQLKETQQLEDAIRCLEGARSFLADLYKRGAA